MGLLGSAGALCTGKFHSILPQGSKYLIIISSPKSPNLHNYYPKPEYLIIRSFGPLGLRSRFCHLHSFVRKSWGLLRLWGGLGPERCATASRSEAQGLGFRGVGVYGFRVEGSGVLGFRVQGFGGLGSLKLVVFCWVPFGV